jgi:hypothetical protein
MTDGIVIFVGAGASFDCCSRRVADQASWRAPLVTELFAERFARVLSNYPLAQTAAARLRPLMNEGSVALEDHLRSFLRDSPEEHRRKQYWEIPLYLQDLLASCSEDYALELDAYDRLIDTVLIHPAVAFVSFNYDVLLDRTLAKFDPLDTMASYFGSDDRNWILFKPHGSIVWSRCIAGGKLITSGSGGFGALARDLADGSVALADEVEQRFPLRLIRRAVQERELGGGDDFHYPSLSVPLGPSGSYSCSSDHVDGFRHWLGEHKRLGVVVAGYSCLDTAPLQMIKDAGATIVDILVSNGTEAAGAEALRRLQDELGPSGPAAGRDQIEVFPRGFNELTCSGSIDAMVSRCCGN